MDLKNFSAALILCGLTACGGDTKSSEGSSLPAGAVVPNPGTGTYFVVEANEGGDSTELRIVGQPVWGRLVDLWALAPITGEPVLYFTDYLIGQEIKSDAVNYTLVRNPVTAKDNLTILHTFGSANYDAAFARLDDGLQSFLDKSLDPGELPPFTALPRNAAMMVRFNDLLDDGGNPSSGQYPGRVNPNNVQVAVGYPPIGLGGVRVIPDPNHGDIINGTFHSTRILIDMSVSQAEALQLGLPQNALGLPEAITQLLPNVVVRIPTQVNAAATQFQVLTNLSGNELGFSSNGSSDPFSPTLDVVRAFRSGGRFANTGDPFNGFLRDEDPPRVLGSQPVTVTQVAVAGNDFLVDMLYGTTACATQPRPGDMLVLPGVVAEVTQLGGIPAAGSVASVQMRLIAGSAANFLPGQGSFRMPWDPSLGVQADCFVQFAPQAGQLPNQMVASDASVVVAFSEPVFPRSANGFSGMRVGYNPPPANTMQTHVVGASTADQDLTEMTFEPAARLSHTQGSSETYTFDLTSGPAGIVDLAGNPLLLGLPQTSFTINSIEPTVNSGSIALQFSSPLLDEDGDGLPEVRGQLIARPNVGEVTTRSPGRFSAIADDSQVSIGAMSSVFPATLFPVTTPIPLTPYGARLQAAWRHVDLGVPMVVMSTIPDPANPGSFLQDLQGWDDSAINIDVEGLSWAPNSAGVAGDYFPEFQLALSHSSFLPDEQLPVAGIAAPFAGNPLSNQPQKIVHARPEGYVLKQLDLFNSTTGTPMAPWPLNRNKALSDYEYYTWRDTSILDLGGAGSTGSDPAVWVTPPGGVPQLGVLAYQPGAVPTIGLPLLMDFRVYPSQASGLNQLVGRVDPVGAGFTTFRAYSAGHNPTSGPPTTVNPDQETQAAGTIVGGLPTLPIDDLLYVGQADFVVRVNQVHTIWFDSGNSSNWKPAVFDPPVQEQPDGTMVSVAYRGAIGITGPFNDASVLDPYGNFLDLLALGPNPPGTATPFAVTYFNGDSTWKTDISDLDGARYIQARITMISNVESSVSPSISAIGFTYEN